MGEGEGRSRSEGACVKVAVREGASLIPRASYQTVSRLQQLLSAQNTQALPFQLKGSLTKSKEEKKIPCRQRAGLPPAQGALRRVLHHPEPLASPSPRYPRSGRSKEFSAERGVCGVRAVPSPAPGSLAGFGVQPSGSALPARAGDGALVEGCRAGGKALCGGWRWPIRAVSCPVGSIAVSAHGAALLADDGWPDRHLTLTQSLRDVQASSKQWEHEP